MASTTIRPFYNQNGYTEFNNYIIDHIMPKLPPNAWKVLCFIIRKTKGWQKEQDQLSINQIIKGTGIKNRTTVSEAIKHLEDKRYILVTRPDDKVTSNTYALNVDLEIKPSTEIGLPKKEGSTKSVPQPSTENRLGVVQKSDSQNKDIKKHENKKDVGARKSLSPKQKAILTIAQICHIDLSVATEKLRGQIKQTCNKLNGKISLETFKQDFENYWYSQDWRGQKGQPPTPPLIREVYGDYCHWIEHGRTGATNGRNHQPNQQETAAKERGQQLTKALTRQKRGPP